VIMGSLAKHPQERFPSVPSLVSALAEALHVSAQEILSPPLSPANAMNGQANLSSTGPTVLPDLESSTVLSSPHIATHAQSSPQSATSESNGQGSPATPPSAPGEEGRRSESPASAFVRAGPSPSPAPPVATSPASASAPPKPASAPSQASQGTTSP